MGMYIQRKKYYLKSLTIIKDNFIIIIYRNEVSMTEYLEKIIHDEEMLKTFIAKGVINPVSLVDEVIKDENVDGFDIWKVGKVIADFKDEEIIDKNLKKELIKKLQDSILDTNSSAYIVNFMMEVKGANIETIVYSLITKDLILNMDNVVKYIYNLKDFKFSNLAKEQRHDLLEKILEYMMRKKEYQKIINIINSIDDNEELFNIIISINDLEFLNYLVNYLENIINKSNDLKQKVELEYLIKKINLAYRILYLEEMDLDSKFKVLVNLYNKGDMATIAHYRDEFAPLFRENKENKGLSR